MGGDRCVALAALIREAGWSQPHVQQGRPDEACAIWNEALDAMANIQSGRARDVIVRMQIDISPVRQRGGFHVGELDRRA